MILAHIVFPGISLSRALTQTGNAETFSMHTHTNAEIFFFVKGRGTFHVEGNAYQLEPGDILLMRPAEAHFVEPDFSQDYERIVLSFDPGVFLPFAPDGSLLRPFMQRETGKRNCFHASEFETNTYQKYLYDMFKCEGDRLALLANLILLLKQIETVFARTDLEHSAPNTMEYHIICYINQNMHRKISITELTERFFLSRSQLCLRFKKATGTSVGKYISVKRLMLACQKIRSAEKPTDVFTECGYQDYSTFCRAYTRLFGHSPKEESAFENVSVQDDYISLS